MFLNSDLPDALVGVESGMTEGWYQAKDRVLRKEEGHNPEGASTSEDC